MGMNEKSILEKLIEREDLSVAEATWLMNGLMDGDFSNSTTAAVLTALRMKGESIEEITAFAQVMREKATRIPVICDRLIDTCGTGGDNSGSFNISTTVALLLAGGGYKLAKHGNRSMTSKSGSADVLEALGVKIDLSPSRVAECIDEVGIGFLFAPLLHRSMKNVVPVRKELAIRTIFNILGPLTNPANARIQTVGLFSVDFVPKIAAVLRALGLESAYVFSGQSGLDEVCIAGPTKVSQLQRSGEITEFWFDPEEYGIPKSCLDQISGGDAKENARIALEILGNEMTGARRDIVCVNAGFAISAADSCSLKEGMAIADTLLSEKAGIPVVEKLRDFSRRFHAEV